MAEKTAPRQKEFGKYVDQNHLVEQFADLFVNLYDRKMPQNAMEVVKDKFGPQKITQLKDSISDLRKENEFMKKQAAELKAKIKTLKEAQQKRKAGYYQN